MLHPSGMKQRDLKNPSCRKTKISGSMRRKNKEFFFPFIGVKRNRAYFRALLKKMIFNQGIDFRKSNRAGPDRKPGSGPKNELDRYGA
jgi:hypothetical protein